MGSSRKKSSPKSHQAKAPIHGQKPAVTQLATLPCVEAELLCIQPEAANLLVNHIDTIDRATYDTTAGQLNLSFRMRVFFPESAISGFRLYRSKAGLDGVDLGALESTAIGTPGLATSHPTLAWAANSRFVVNTRIDVAGLVPGDLLMIGAQVGDQVRPVARIYVTGKNAVSAPDLAT